MHTLDVEGPAILSFIGVSTNIINDQVNDLLAEDFDLLLYVSKLD